MKYLSFNELVARGVLTNRVTLGRWIAEQSFPPGVLLGPNTRRWREDEVEAWLVSRASRRTPAQQPAPEAV